MPRTSYAAVIEWTPPEWMPESWIEVITGKSETTDISGDAALVKGALLWKEGQDAEANGKKKIAIKRYRNIAKHYGQTLYAPKSLERIAMIRIEEKKYKKALQALEEIIKKHAQYPAFNAIIQKQYEVASLSAETKSGRYLRFIPYRDTLTAVTYLESIVQNAPYNDHAPQALMKIAEIYRYSKNQIAVIETLERLINSYPNSPITPQAYLEMGEAYVEQSSGPSYDQGAIRKAIGTYQDLLLLYPDSPQIAEAEKKLAEAIDNYAASKLILGQYYKQYRQNNKAALAFLSETITIAPSSSLAEKARNLIFQMEEVPSETNDTGLSN